MWIVRQSPPMTAFSALKQLTVAAFEEQNGRFDGLEQRLNKLEQRADTEDDPLDGEPIPGPVVFESEMPPPTESVPDKPLSAFVSETVTREAHRRGWTPRMSKAQSNDLFRGLWGYLYRETR